MPAINARLFGGKDIERALVNAFEEWTREDVNGAFWDDQFKEEKWRHSPYTERENGDTVGSPRDIYDLGNLYDSGVNSYKYQSSATGASANWHWDAKNRSGEEYAWYVHEWHKALTTHIHADSLMTFPSNFPLGALLEKLCRVECKQH
jgi:hypothetical protein